MVTRMAVAHFKWNDPIANMNVNHYQITHSFHGFFLRTTLVSWHQKGKAFWILMKQEMTGGNWQWHQFDQSYTNHLHLAPEK